MQPAVRGFVLVDKPAGQTSFSVLGTLKKALPGVKIGHTGTLDSFATGLMVVVLGPYSRLAPWFTGLDKEYRATIRFGIETSTLDPEGGIVATSSLPDEERLRAVLPAFLGKIQQIPPAYSALHIDGERASARARRGEEFLLKPRPITIYDIKIESFDAADMTLYVRCSSGTYVRALARDIALACGTRAHLVALRRLSVGPFHIDQALSPERLASTAAREAAGATQLSAAAARNSAAAAREAAAGMARLLRPFDTDSARSIGLQVRLLDAAAACNFSQGKKLRTGELAGASVREACGTSARTSTAYFSTEGEFLGIADTEKGFLRYRMVMPPAQQAQAFTTTASALPQGRQV